MSELKLPGTSQTAIKQVKGGKLELVFSKGATVRPDRWEFRDRDDLIGHLGKLFGGKRDNVGLNGSVKRKGKYQRTNAKGDLVFTFGDPILDLITDEHGQLSLGGRRYDLRATELGMPDLRGGGITSIDLADHNHQQMVLEAALGKGGFTLIEAAGDRAVLASTTPSVMWIYDGTAKMRFRAWKKNYFAYWSIGAEIETWGANFSSASIQSDYGQFIGGSAICGIVKHDSDSDTNDDYVDEYEWGSFSSPPTGVRSMCTALWRGVTRSGLVTKGDCGYWHE